MWTVLTVIVQLSLAPTLKLTARLEFAVALTAKSLSPNVFPDSVLKVIAWSAFAIANERETAIAAS